MVVSKMYYVSAFGAYLVLFYTQYESHVCAQLVHTRPHLCGLGARLTHYSRC